MFSLFKNQKEKKLVKLGFQSLIDAYKEKFNSGEWTKETYKKAIDTLYKDKKTAIENIDNIQVSTRQTYDDDEVISPLNLQNIRQHFIDYDFVYSSLLFEYKNHNKIHIQAIDTLEKWLEEQFPTAKITESHTQNWCEKDTNQLIEKALEAITEDNADEIKTIFTLLKNRT
ncbi:hypothetical protein AB4865_00165 [Capnocytophaga sp. ARDL2]|uniref:hypothetical protein n=1 Tax=Capnocytophaga sp. ARDL2 TaxID=3238809 RepID=UPI0035591385